MPAFALADEPLFAAAAAASSATKERVVERVFMYHRAVRLAPPLLNPSPQ